MRVDVFMVKTHFRNEGKLFQNAVEPTLPGHQRCPLRGDAPRARRGGVNHQTWSNKCSRSQGEITFMNSSNSSSLISV